MKNSNCNLSLENKVYCLIKNLEFFLTDNFDQVINFYILI